ncbi:unnamed protein product [Adineta steineri]|uniref:Uncharacterized protein n=1 Tax=Adineta steineri TaxID=433720 RepID=A0A815LMI7_9BILA|nr:unnamed protein product [Adineta steineri]CAF1408789.1 unnamed protein product [Adineta steineri]
MYPGPFKPVPMGFQYPGQQPASSLYQSPYGAYNNYAPPTRERSVPASTKANLPPTGPYAPTPTRRHSKHSRPTQCQHYDYNNTNQESKCNSTKRYQRQPYTPPNGVADQSLYSDEVKTSEELNRSPSPPSKSRLKPEDINNFDHEQKLNGYKHASGEIVQNGDELRNSQDYNKRKSRSKRRAHHRHHHGPQPSSSQKRVTIYSKKNNEIRMFVFFKNQHPPLYNSHYQSHEDSSRRDDAYYKQAKRPARATHIDERHAAGVVHPPERPYSSVYSPYSPYQQPPGYYTPAAHYNPPPPVRQNPPDLNSPFEREIQRLRNHIHALESELQNLQRKIHKTTLNHPDTATQDDYNFKKHRGKRHSMRSPRQTPVIVEINNGHGDNVRDLSSKKRHHRAGSHVNSQRSKQQQPQLQPQPQPPQAPPPQQQQLRHSSKVPERVVKLHNYKAPSQSPKEQEINVCDCACIVTNHIPIPEPDVKPIPIVIAKQPREEAAVQLAQLAHAAAARVQARQHIPPPPPVQHQHVQLPEPLPPQSQQMIRDLNGSHPQKLMSTDLNNNHNQLNNNEIYNLGERNNRSAEKILDAFERFYKNIGRSSTSPVKVKYIPGEANCNHCQHRNINTNTNIQCPTGSRLSQSSSTTSSISERVVIQECKQKTTFAYA